jgi:hypothetical protein
MESRSKAVKLVILSCLGSTHIHTQTHIDTHRHTQTHTHTLPRTHSHTHKQTDTQTHRHTDTHCSFLAWGPTKDGFNRDLRARQLATSKVGWCCACPEPMPLQDEMNISEWVPQPVDLHHCMTQTASKQPPYTQAEQSARLESMHIQDTE